MLLDAGGLSESPISQSLILMLSVSLLISEDSLKLIFRMCCDLLLFCVSAPVQLVSLILFFFIFMRLLRLVYLYNWCVSSSLWKPSFIPAFHCDFPSLGTSWIKMSPLLLTVYIPPLFFLCDFPSLWFLNFLNNDICYEQTDRAVNGLVSVSMMYLWLWEYTVPQQNQLCM